MLINFNYSEVAGLFLIDPAIENLLDFDPSSQTTPPSNEQSELLGWPEFWNSKLVPSVHGKWLSSAIGFTRIAVMVGLTSAVEEPDLKEILTKDVLLRKVSDNGQCCLNTTVMYSCNRSSQFNIMGY